MFVVRVLAKLTTTYGVGHAGIVLERIWVDFRIEFIRCMVLSFGSAEPQLLSDVGTVLSVR